MSSRKRGREPPNRYAEDPITPSKLGRGEFNEVEDAQLLSALFKHGPVDISKLVPYIPTRNTYQIKQRVSSLQRKAQQSLTTVRTQSKNGSEKIELRDKVAIDRWLESLHLLHEKAEIIRGVQDELPVHMIARCMSLIAKYEEHPKPEESGGVDFKYVYEFLESMLIGLPSKNVSIPDAKLLIEALQYLSSQLDTLDLGREKSFVFYGNPQWRSIGLKPRTYSKKSEEEDPEDTNELLKFLSSDKFNPFQIPLEWLKKKL